MRHRCQARTWLPIVLMTLAPSPSARAQQPSTSELAQASEERAGSGFDELRALLAIPNDAHFPEQVERNLSWMRTAFERRGFTTQVLATGGPPLLLAARAAGNRSARTVLFYVHIDGQPTDPSRWDQDSPYAATLKRPVDGGWETISWERLQAADRDPDWRIFARSASDDKSPVIMLLSALDAADERGWEISFNVKVIMDFEEELGSPHLAEAVARNGRALAADALLICDGPRHISNRPSLTFGARGIATVVLTVFGPRVPQHSGHDGNYAPNPAMRLSRLLASMKDDEGRVTIPGFYDGVNLTDEDLAELALVPDDEQEILRGLGVAAPDRVGRTYQESLQYPSLNVRGMASGWVGAEARTIVPATATADIDVRLVPESDPVRLLDLIREHVRTRGYHLVEGAPTEAERARYDRLASMSASISYGAFRTPLDSPTGRWLVAAMVRAFGEEPIRKRMSGGSVPIAPFISTLGVPAVTVPTVNADNNQHSPNENLRVGNFGEGIRTFLAILTQPLSGG